MGKALESESLRSAPYDLVRGAARNCRDARKRKTVSLVERQSGLVSLKAEMKCPRDGDRGATRISPVGGYGHGQPAALYEAYGSCVAWVVEVGSHRIEIRYRPKSVYWARCCPLLGLAELACWLH